MRVAIIYSGGCRSFDRCLPNHVWMLHRFFPDAHYFFSTYRDGSEHQAELLREKYPGRVEIEIVDKQPLFEFDKPWTPGAFYSHEPYAISVSPQAVLGQLWQLERAWKLKGDKDFDAIIRCRPDIWFQELQMPKTPLAHHAYVPNFGFFGGVNDRFAIMGPCAAAGYFQTFLMLDGLQKMGAPIHPETLVKEALELVRARIFAFHCIFSTRRISGEMRNPEICPADFVRLHRPIELASPDCLSTRGVANCPSTNTVGNSYLEAMRQGANPLG